LNNADDFVNVPPLFTSFAVQPYGLYLPVENMEKLQQVVDIKTR